MVQNVGSDPARPHMHHARRYTVTLPSYEATLGVTINTAPAAIWLWLIQMGYRRGGLYSHDRLDRLFGYLDAPSAERILPQWQLPAVGDEIPIGRGGGFPVRRSSHSAHWCLLDTRRAEAIARTERKAA